MFATEVLNSAEMPPIIRYFTVRGKPVVAETNAYINDVVRSKSDNLEKFVIGANSQMPNKDSLPQFVLDEFPTRSMMIPFNDSQR